MNIHLRTVLLLLSVLSGPTVCFGQEEGEGGDVSEWKRFRGAIVSSNAHVPAMVDIRDREVIPAWGVEFEYKLAERWVVGLATEMEIQSYVISEGKHTELEREYPVTISAVAAYEITKHIYFGMGGGVEIEKNKNFGIISYFTGYNWKFPNNWDFGPSISYNDRIDAFDTWSFNLVFGKSF